MSTNEPILKCNEIIGNRYRVVKQIGRQYKEVFICLDTNNDNEEVVVKLEKIGLSKESRLENECNLYKTLSNCDSFAFVLNNFNDTDFRFIVMKKLGINLQTHYDEYKRSTGHKTGLELKTVLEYADQMISRLTNCHLRNIIHRDIKPENFVFDLNHKKLIYLIDLNLGKEYRDRNLIHIPHRVKNPMFSVGNVQFLSINAHKGEEQSRRDDMLSLGYSLIYLAKGSLPWNHILHKDYRTRYDYMKAVESVKVNTSIHMLCNGLPKQFAEYMTICENLEFFDAPNYIQLRTLFKTALNELSNHNTSLPSVQMEFVPKIQSNNDSTNHSSKLSEMVQRIRGSSPHMICA